MEIVMGETGAIVMLVGILGGIFCLWFWLTVAAFKVSPVWSILLLFLPFVSGILFTILHWKTARRPVIVGGGLFAIGVITYLLRINPH